MAKKKRTFANFTGRDYKTHDGLLALPILLTAILISLYSVTSFSKPAVVDIIPVSNGTGYWQIIENGNVEAKNGAPDEGDLVNAFSLRAAARSGDGFVAVSARGAVFVYNGARYHGGIDGSPPPAEVVDIIVANNGDGYRIVDAHGNVYDFNVEAVDKGSLVDRGIDKSRLTGRIVAATSTRSGEGYYLFGEDGKVYAFGDAPYVGSPHDDGITTKIIDAAGINKQEDGYIIVNEDGGLGEYHSLDILYCSEQSSNSKNVISLSFGDSGCVFGYSDGTSSLD